jgi:hypothetical protein
MIWIPLLTGGQVQVSNRKYEKAVEKEWYQKTDGYVVSVTYPEVYLHQFLFGRAPEGFQWSFKDGDKLNNRDSNLVLISHSQRAKKQWKKKKSKN